MDPSLIVRHANVGDAAVIARHRVAMFIDMGIIATDDLATSLLQMSTSFIANALRDEVYVGWLVIDPGDQVIAGAGVHFMTQQPRISEQRTHVVTEPMPVVQNVYTEPARRHQGIARALMKVIMRWAAEAGLDRLVLQASDEGRPLYMSLGFTPTREMGWVPRGARRGQE